MDINVNIVRLSNVIAVGEVANKVSGDKSNSSAIKGALAELGKTITEPVKKSSKSRKIKQIKQSKKEDVKKVVSFFNEHASKMNNNDGKIVREFFYQTLSQFDSETFDRSKINKDLQNVLSPELKQQRQEKQQQIGLSHDVSKINLKQARFNRKIAKVKLADRLGVTAIKNKGATGSLILTDIKGEKIGIFKELDPKKMSLIRKIEIFFKNYFGFLGISRPTNYLPGGQAPSKGYAEATAFAIDQELGFNITPTTFLTELQGERGSFQLFVKAQGEAKEIFSKPKHIPDEKERDTFQNFIVFDYLIGNLDRHEENWLVRKTDDDKLECIFAIDNGNSFPETHPSKKDTRIRKNQYRWRKHPFGKKPMTPKTKRLIESLTEEKINKIFDEQNALHNKDSFASTFFSNDMKANTMRRLQVLKKWASESSSTPADLARCISDKEINDYLHSMPAT